MDKKFKSESIEIHRLLMTKHEKRKLKNKIGYIYEINKGN